MDLVTRDNRIIAVHPALDGPANEGALCVKGQFAYDYVHHPDRLTHPLVRDAAGRLQQASWDEALQRAAQGFMDVLQKHGRHAVYGVASGRTPSEANYMMQKFIRVGFGSNYIDNCSRA
jgi:predicted molibdopterin-dependent oxidoreductase YjgC